MAVKCQDDSSPWAGKCAQLNNRTPQVVVTGCRQIDCSLTSVSKGPFTGKNSTWNQSLLRQNRTGIIIGYATVVRSKSDSLKLSNFSPMQNLLKFVKHAKKVCRLTSSRRSGVGYRV